MKSLFRRGSLFIALGLYALVLADVSSGFSILSLSMSLAVGATSLLFVVVLSRLSAFSASYIPFALLVSSFLAVASRIGAYETVVHRSETEWETYQHQLGLDIAEGVSRRFTDLCRRAELAAEQLARHPALHSAVADPGSQQALTDAFRAMTTVSLPHPMEEAVSGASLYDEWQYPLSWVGKSVELGPYFESLPSEPESRVFVLEKGVYTYLIAFEPLTTGIGSVAVEVPLAVRRSLNNRYLTDFEAVSRWSGKSLETDYVDARREAPELAQLFQRSEERYWGGTPEYPMLHFPLRSPSGEVLGVSSLGAEERSTAVLEKSREASRFAGFFLVLAAFTIVGLLATRLLAALEADREKSRWIQYSLLFAASLWGMRIVLLLANVPLGLGTDSDNPAHYASTAFFDFFRSPADLFITSLVTLACVAAFIMPWLRHKEERSSRSRHPLSALLTLVIATATVLAIFILINGVISDTWLNSSLPLSRPGLVPPQAPLLTIQFGWIALFLSAGVVAFFIFVAAERLTGGRDAEPLNGVLQRWVLDFVVFVPIYLLVGRDASLGMVPALVPFLVIHLLALERRHIYDRLTARGPYIRFVTALLLVLVPVLSLYPAIAYYEQRATRHFMATTVSPTVLHHGASLNYVLRDTLEAIDRMELSGRLGLPERADLAYEIWSGSDLSVTALSSSVEVFDDQGTLVSRFALNFPSGERSPTEPDEMSIEDWPDREDWHIWPVPYVGEPNRPRIWNARRVMESSDRSLWDLRVRLVADWSNLPFVTVRNPYIDLFRASSIEPPMPSQHGELSLHIFDLEGNSVFSSSESALAVETEFFDDSDQQPTWFELPLEGRQHEVYFFSDDSYIYALTYPGKSVLGSAAEVVGWALLAGITAIALLLSAALLSTLRGFSFVSPRDLWAGVGVSFYGKLFVAFIFLALVPTVLLAVLARSIVVQQLQADVEQEGVARARVAKGVVRDYLLLQTMEARERGVAAVDDVFLEWVRTLVDADVDLYSRGELTATSKRELFASGLLPTRAVPEVFRELVLERIDFSVHQESVGAFNYLVVSVPISIERYGEPGILSIPLASRRREINRQVEALNQTVLLAAIAFSLVAAALAFSLARRIADPINRLTDATRRVAQGDFDVELDAPSEDEIGLLSQSFNQMTSDLKRQREHLERTKKLEAWAEMARQVAHEVKNPLTPIQLSTEHLLRVFGDPNVDFKKVLKDCTETILQQVRALRQISMEFSTFANPLPIVAELTDFAELVREVVNPYSQAPPEGVAVELDVSPELPPVEVDKRLVQRTIVNLMENAFHAINGRGYVHVIVRPIKINENPWIEVAVADNGAGIEPELQEHIFEPYFSTRVAGTGLGLAISRQAVEEHGGTISLASEPGKGTEVRIRLPVTLEK